jgi:iron complex transport system substrate-binding protein
MRAIGPQRIVCLTEETTEWLYLLGQDWRIVGISGYTVRPPQARAQKPRVSAFLDGKIDKILALKPDLILGFSDMQATLAEKLIRAGLTVLVTNQRSVAEIFSTLRMLGNMVGASVEAECWIKATIAAHHAMQATTRGWAQRPKVYFEEWDTPAISAIQWVSELISIAGGCDIFPELSLQALGKNRIIADPSAVIARAPDLIIGSWCGKKFRPEKISARPGWAAVPAVKTAAVFEIKSCDILQPGPAALTDGVAQMHQLFCAWQAARLC